MKLDWMKVPPDDSIEGRVIRSKTKHDKERTRGFATLQYKNRRAIGNCSDTLMYTIIYGDKHLDTRYLKGVISVIVTDSHRYAVGIQKDVNEDYGKCTEF